MSFKILYIEDDPIDAERVSAELAAINAKRVTRPVSIKAIPAPELLAVELNQHYDLVLADACYPDVNGTQKNRLDDIIEAVETWSKTNQLERPVPIIAYTRRDKGAIEHCLKRRDYFFDIWDKSSASPEYAAWRMTRIASEIARFRPDSLLQRQIRQMPSGARWHGHVVEMTRAYSSGWTESDQIDRVQASIGAIAMNLGVAPQCKSLWKIMQSWEPLSRAVSETARGHARHVLNVFWLGYYLLHQPALCDFFSGAWTNVLDRGDMGAVKSQEPLQALSDCWFYAGLFHDVAGCIEKHGAITGKANALFKEFKAFIAPIKNADIQSSQIERQAQDLLGSMKGLRGALESAWNASLASQNDKPPKPDHGVVAAVHLLNGIKEPAQHCFAHEAARAMVVHNLISSLPNDASFPLTWEKEPIVCLLLLCDQLQTWDRERGTDTLSDQDGSERAELVDLNVSTESGRVQINLGIDYLGPRFLDHAPIIYNRVKQRLENILQDYPHRALNRITGPWPFSLIVNCSLNGRPVNGLKFGAAS